MICELPKSLKTWETPKQTCCNSGFVLKVFLCQQSAIYQAIPLLRGQKNWHFDKGSKNCPNLLTEEPKIASKKAHRRAFCISLVTCCMSWISSGGSSKRVVAWHAGGIQSNKIYGSCSTALNPFAEALHSGRIVWTLTINHHNDTHHTNLSAIPNHAQPT